eukprot:6322513-Prymnesium_polylepis.1
MWATAPSANAPRWGCLRPWRRTLRSKIESSIKGSSSISKSKRCTAQHVSTCIGHMWRRALGIWGGAFG